MSENYFMLDGKKVVMSEETEASLRAKWDERVWKHGDVAINENDQRDNMRLIIEVGYGKLEIYTHGYKPLNKISDSIEETAEFNHYKYLGNIFDGTYKP